MAYSPYDISLPTSTIRQITNLTHNTNSNVINAFASGETSPAAFFTGDSPHSTSMTSTDLSTILGLNDGDFIQEGACFESATTTVPFRKRDDCAQYMSGDDHLAIQSSNTLMTPDTINGAQGESATIDCTLRYKSTDGFASSVTQVTGQTLSTATFIGEYVLHSVVIDGVELGELQSVTITPGISITEQKQGGGPFTTAFFNTETSPIIEVTTEDVSRATALVNSSLLGSGVVVYFAKRKDGGIIEAEGNSDHIKITGANTAEAAKAMAQATTIGGDSRSNAAAVIRFNSQLLIATTGTAIT